MLDALFALIIVLSSAWGFIRGGLFHLLGIVALVLAFMVSPLPGAPIGRLLASRTDWSAGASQLVGRIGVFIVTYAVLIAIAAVADHRFRKIRNVGVQGANRALGGLFGLVWGLAVCLLLACLGDVWLKVYPNSAGFVAGIVRNSRLRRAVSSSNPADRFLVTDTLRLLRVARQDPETMSRLRRHPQVISILDHPDMKRLLADEEFARALQDQDVNAVLKNENLGIVLSNSELRALVLSPETRAALQDAAGPQAVADPKAAAEGG